MTVKIDTLFANSNSHLGKDILHFSKSTDSCTNATVLCNDVCKVKKGNYQFPSVRNYMQKNLDVSREDTFFDLLRMNFDITKNVGEKRFRWHTSGDFEDETEFIETMKVFTNVDKDFLVYTKLPLNKHLMSFVPSNVTIRFSYDDTTPEEYVNAAKDLNVPLSYMDAFLDKKKAKHMAKHRNGFVCTSSCTSCKFCWYSTKDVVFPMTYNGKKQLKRIHHYLNILNKKDEMVQLI